MVGYLLHHEALLDSLPYTFGSLSGYITADGGISGTEVKYSNTTISWTIPTTFYDQIPSSKTGVCTLTIKTYSGSTQIGDDQTCTLTISAAQSSSAPSVSGTVVDSNATTKSLTGDETKLVRYYSTALCTIAATAKDGASIATKKIGGVVVSENTRSIANIEASSIAFYAKDSRGYETSVNVALTLIPYVILTNNASGQRTDPVSGAATVTVKGDFFNGSFGSTSNSLEIKYRYREAGGSFGSYSTVTPNISGNSYTASISVSDLDYESEYEFEVVVSDKLATVTKIVSIQSGVPGFDWGKNDFNFNTRVHFSENGVGDSSGMIRKMANGIWIGDSKDRGSAEITKGTGIFVDTQNYEVYKYVNGVGERLTGASEVVAVFG